MRCGRDDAGILAILILLATLPSVDAQAPTIAVAFEGPASIPLDMTHLSARFRVVVTNHGTALDYVTVPRHDIRWVDNGQSALGFPSPEFGVSLAPGASAPMFVHVDLNEPRLGAREVELPFHSERTGATVKLRGTVVVGPALPASERIVVTVEPASASVSIVDLTATHQPDVQPLAREGLSWSATVAPGTYAVRADAPGHQGASRILNLPRDAAHVRLTLAPARWAADEISFTSASADESAWLLAGSTDLSRLVTAPMVHSQETPGRFVSFEQGARDWSASFDATRPPHTAAGPFQALDTSAAVSPDGALVAGFDWNGELHVYDGATGTLRWSDERADDRSPLYPPESDFGRGFFTSGALTFSPDGATLAAGGSNGHLVAFHAANATPRWTRDFSAEIRALQYLPDGSALVVGSGDWRLHLLDAATGATRWSADEPQFWPFFSIATSADGTLVAAGGKDSTFRVWRATDGALLYDVDVYPAFVTGYTVGPWGSVFSDWTYGVRATDANGDITWFHRYRGANAVTTNDGRITLVGWSTEGGSDSGLALLDDTGTTLWTSKPGIHAACTSTSSPFPAKQIKSVLLAEPAPGRLRLAASCIGGGVFTAELSIRELATPTPATPSPGPSLSPPQADGPAPSPAPTPNADPAPFTPTSSATPSPAWLALAALLLASATTRRR